MFGARPFGPLGAGGDHTGSEQDMSEHQQQAQANEEPGFNGGRGAGLGSGPLGGASSSDDADSIYGRSDSTVDLGAGSARADGAAPADGAAQGDAGRQLPPCIACHGVRLTGREPGIPGLAGLRPNYINAQLTRWRSGERRAASPDCMQRIASRLEESDIVAVSAWLAAQPAPQSPAPDHGLTSPRMPQACGSQP